MATLTLAESYTGAFMMGDKLEIKFSGIPEDATLKAIVTGIKIAVMASDDNGIEAVMTDNDDPYATVSSISSMDPPQ